MATKIPDQLKDIADQVYQGAERTESVRTLLSWFNADRRGKWVVGDIRKALRKLKLATQPDFEDVWIDAPIKFQPKLPKAKKGDEGKTKAAPEEESSNNGGSAPVPKKSAEDLKGINPIPMHDVQKAGGAWVLRLPE